MTAPKAARKSTRTNRLHFYHEGQPYMRMIPAKGLFHSTTVYEVITRGDMFAVNLDTGVFTILKAGSDATKQTAALV